jgi:leucine dehydrogenase
MVHQPLDLDNFQEQIHLIEDRADGVSGLIVVHSQVLGPAAGGCRLWGYSDHAAMQCDASRLARGMTYKNALAGLPFGGGKAVLQMPAGTFDRAAMFRALGDAVESLGGAYITAEDVGTSIADMRSVAERTGYVAGLDARSGLAGGDPSPWTALGVTEAMQAAIAFAGEGRLKGKRVALQGAGNVGAAIATLLSAAGATLLVADVDRARAQRVAGTCGGTVVDPQTILLADVDIVVPCALGGILDEAIVEKMRARLVCGAANNQLASPFIAEMLRDRGILYAPDYVVNAGGIINVAAEYLGEGTTEVRDRMAQIPDRLTAILEAARNEGLSTVAIADRQARSIIAQAWARAA